MNLLKTPHMHQFQGLLVPKKLSFHLIFCDPFKILCLVLDLIFILNTMRQDGILKFHLKG